MYTYNQSGVRLQQVITIQVNKLIQVITYRSVSCIKMQKITSTMVFQVMSSVLHREGVSLFVF